MSVIFAAVILLLYMSDSSYFEESLKICLSRRREYIGKNNLEAYRLVHLGEHEVPVAIDIYAGNAVVHVFDVIDSETVLGLEKAIRAVVPVTDVFYKNRTKKEIHLPVSAKKDVLVHEYGAAFYINLSDYLDVGLFLDHRETRKWIASLSKGKVVLNTFAYTGSFSVHSALAGAEKTYSVDLSRTYCEWIKKNLELNGLTPEKNWVYKMDTLEFFKYAKRKNLTFDIIIIDPPTFSKNKGEHFSVQKDHPALINAALDVLSKDGLIMFSNNFTNFEMSENKLSGCKIEEREDLVAPDFPDVAPHRCFIIRK